MINLNKERRRCVMNDINLITAKAKKETSSLRTFLNYVIPSITSDAYRVIPLLADSQHSADNPPPVPGAARVSLPRSRGSE